MTADDGSQPLTDGQRRAALEAFARALNREAHNLRHWPHLTWQQLYNRLRWEEEPVPRVLKPELAHRTTPSAAPWIRLHTPLRESVALIRTLAGHTDKVWACAFSPDGRRIVSGSTDMTLKIWDVESGAELRTLTGHAGSVRACAFSPDGRRIVSGSVDNTLKLWDAESGAELRSLEGQPPGWEDETCAFSPDGRRIVSCGQDRLREWDAGTGTEVPVLEGWGACASSPNGRRIVFQSRETHSLRVWDAEPGAELRTLAGRIGQLYACAFSPGGESVAAVSCSLEALLNADLGVTPERTLKVWDAESGAELHTLEGPSRSVRAFAFSPDGREIVSGNVDNTLKVWNAESGAELCTLEGHSGSGALGGYSGSVRACAISPDGHWIVSASKDKTLKIWDAQVGAEVRTFEALSRQEVTCAEFSPDGRRIVSGSADMTLKIRDLESGAELRTLAGHAGSVFDCAFSSDGRRILSTSADRTVKVWDADTGAALSTLEVPSDDFRWYVRCAAFSPDGRRIVSGIDGHGLVVWDAESGAELLAAGVYAPGACAFSPDGGRIVSARIVTTGEDGLVVLDAESGAGLRTLTGHTGWVHDCAFSPDGRRIASASHDQTLKVWDAESGAELWTLSGHTEEVRACVFSPDGRWIVSASQDKTFKVWDAETGGMVAVLPVVAPLLTTALHPWLPRAVCVDDAGSLYPVGLVGIEYGPIIVTATDRGQGPVVRCPACWQKHTLEPSRLGADITCPTPGCALRLRVNPFIAGPPQKWRESAAARSAQRGRLEQERTIAASAARRQPEEIEKGRPWWQLWRRG